MKSSFVILTSEAWFNEVMQQLPSQIQEIVSQKANKIQKFGKDLVEIADYNGGYYSEDDELFSEFEEVLFNSYEDVYVKTFDFD